MNSLTYQRTVRGVPQKHANYAANGVLYLHHFGTGWQELVFPDHAHAARFAVNNGCEYVR